MDRKRNLSTIANGDPDNSLYFLSRNPDLPKSGYMCDRALEYVPLSNWARGLRAVAMQSMSHMIVERVWQCFRMIPQMIKPIPPSIREPVNIYSLQDMWSCIACKPHTPIPNDLKIKWRHILLGRRPDLQDLGQDGFLGAMRPGELLLFANLLLKEQTITSANYKDICAALSMVARTCKNAKAAMIAELEECIEFFKDVEHIDQFQCVRGIESKKHTKFSFFKGTAAYLHAGIDFTNAHSWLTSHPVTAITIGDVPSEDEDDEDDEDWTPELEDVPETPTSSSYSEQGFVTPPPTVHVTPPRS